MSQEPPPSSSPRTTLLKNGSITTKAISDRNLRKTPQRLQPPRRRIVVNDRHRCQQKPSNTEESKQDKSAPIMYSPQTTVKCWRAAEVRKRMDPLKNSTAVLRSLSQNDYGTKITLEGCSVDITCSRAPGISKANTRLPCRSTVDKGHPLHHCAL